MPRIQDQVAENRRGVQRINSRFILAPGRKDTNLSFGSNTFTITIGIDVYTRPLNNSLISGHPDGGTHGSGFGVAGDTRGSWTLRESTASSSEWTRDGRNAVRDSLAGSTGSIAEIAVGTGSADADVFDTALASETGRTDTYGIRSTEGYNEVRARANFLFAETGSSGLDPIEYGVFDASGRLLARATSGAVSVGQSEEVRVDVTATIEGDGNGSSVVTDNGESTVADSLQSGSITVGLDEIAWGTGTTDPADSDTALANEVIRATCQRETSLEEITVSAPQFEDEPSGQPYDYTEVGVFDNNGQLVWRSTIDPFTKDSDTQFVTAVAFRII